MVQAAALGWGVKGNTCQLRSPTVLLALLLRVELVPVALAAPIAEGDALALGCIEGPACHRCLAGTRDNGQSAGSCRDRSCVSWGSRDPHTSHMDADTWHLRQCSDPL